VLLNLKSSLHEDSKEEVAAGFGNVKIISYLSCGYDGNYTKNASESVMDLEKRKVKNSSIKMNIPLFFSPFFAESWFKRYRGLFLKVSPLFSLYFRGKLPLK